MRSTTRRTNWMAMLVVGTAFGAGEAAAEDRIPERVEFNRDVRPILADACFHCHGPDATRRQADLRFDTEAGATADLGDGRRAIVPKDPAASELVRRISSNDPNLKMPPPDAERQLTPRQIAILTKWIEQGASWEKHWAFVAPKRPPTPSVKSVDRIRTPVDAFVLARLESEGLSFSPDADRATLLRRVTLDLTGLPPTPGEAAAFVADDSPDAYEKVVDRLLASPRFGERMAARWLDGARYADTSGYQSDGDRVMWRWRDWVLDAYNANMPFDQFTVEQLAGDLLPNATLDQKLATGFNRNHRGNGEGGIIPEEYAVEYVVDRVETTATVWLGVTMMCVRCHTHKYDPFEHKEFYGLFAFFNNVPEKGRAVKYGNSPPYLTTPTRDQQAELDRMDRELAAVETAWTALQPKIDERLAATLAGPGIHTGDDTPTRGLMLYYNLNQDAMGKITPSGRAKPAAYLGADRLLDEKTVPNGNLRHGLNERVVDGKDDRDGIVAGKVDWAFDGDGQRFIDAGDVAKVGFYDRFSIGAWIKPRGDAGGTIVSRMADVPRGSGYAIALDKGRVQAQFQVRWLDDAMRVETAEPILADQWSHLLVTYDGSREAAGVAIYVDGVRRPTRVLLDELNQNFESKEPLRIAGGHGPNGRFHGLIDEVRLYDVALSDDEAAVLGANESLADVLKTPAEKRTPRQNARIRASFIARDAGEAVQGTWTRLQSLRDARQKYVESLPTTMVMVDMPTPRETYLLLRGEYDKPGERVDPGVPAAIAPWSNDLPKNRLGLAQWLVDPANPLTARVAVNRMWQQFFGTGLVKTVDDFGIQGEWPSHPELLDWLAVEFGGKEPGDRSQETGVKTGANAGTTPDAPLAGSPPSSNPQSAIRNPQSWNLKRLIRQLVTSTAYRQSSRASAALVQRDPENRLLARGPRFRLPAEMIRDQALFASGLLVERVGGPSVKPYQPAGLYKDLTGSDYEPDHGDALYRRSLYTYWKRTIAPPAMMTFDAAGRETCIVKETRTNTPLQALNLMNDVTYVEASRFLAERMLREGGTTSADRVRFGFLAVTGREPSPRETTVLTAGLERHLAHYRANPEAADKLTKTGERPRTASLDVPKLAACTATAGLILNLDEAVTRE